jgi:cation/acetate symporter
MPHVLMRMNTAASPRVARQGVFLGTGIIVLFHLIVLLLGFMAMVLVGGDAIRSADAGGNMALPLLAHVVGGPVLLGVVGAVALSTILAVTAGLGIAGAAALSHDLVMPALAGWATAPRLELFVGRASSVILIVVALGLAAIFHGQNLAFLSALAGALAASANFPVLVLAIFYKGFTAIGAIAGMLCGTLASIILIVASPLVQISVLGHSTAPFPLRNPGIVTIPIAFLVAMGVSLATKNKMSVSDSTRAGTLSQDSR